MEKLFVIVTSRKHKGAVSTKINGYLEESSVTEILGKIAINADDPREIERIFSVDEFGNVEHYEVIYTRGKLKLQLAPNMLKGVQYDGEMS